MNCIPGLSLAARQRQASRTRLVVAAAVLLGSCAACGAPAEDREPASPPLDYHVTYHVVPDAAAGSVRVTLELEQARSLLRELRFRGDARLSNVAGDGDVVRSAGATTWRPPPRGGSLTWQVAVAHRRNGGGYDAFLGSNWGLFRAEDIIPRAATRTLKGARSKTSLTFELPRNWSVVTQYSGSNGRFDISNPARRFDQPNGWIVLGKLGVRRDVIAGSRIAVAGPAGQSVRRLDILALLNWTLPELARVLPELPPRLTIVSAGDPMWRGGLSAPQSMFLHADRPLISENATSTLLHELMHVSLGLSARHGFDWIVEGLAEYYSLELLRRSGTISAPRHKQALETLTEWSAESEALCGPVADGATTALAVALFGKLERELRDVSGGEAGLDDLVRALWQADEPVDLDALRVAAAEIGAAEPDTLRIDNLPGCRTIGTDQP